MLCSTHGGVRKIAAAFFPHNHVLGRADENGLIREVRHRLVMLPRFGVFDDIGFTVNGRTVTLEGQVALPVLKTTTGFGGTGRSGRV